MYCENSSNAWVCQEPKQDEVAYAVRLLDRFYLKSVVASWLPSSRISFCLRRKIPGSEIAVLLSKVKARASLGGLMVCGLIWLCAVCAIKISERRRPEIKQAVKEHVNVGGYVSHVTYTLPHHLGQSLALLLHILFRVRRLYLQHVTYQDFSRSIRLLGSIFALEITWGSKNGWHAHIHELLFHFSPIDYRIHEKRLRGMWADTAFRLGYSVPNDHGVTLTDGSYADEYLSKWGLDCEMTKQHIKKGREGNLTPFDLIRAGMQDQFCEYAAAIHRKKHLTWSPGLKQWFGIGDVSDEDLCKAPDEGAALLGYLTDGQWKRVWHSDNEPGLLLAAQSGGWAAVIDFVDSLCKISKEK